MGKEYFENLKTNSNSPSRLILGENEGHVWIEESVAAVVEWIINYNL